MAFSGMGTTFNYWDGSQWVPLAGVKTINGPTSERGTIDVTTLDTTGGYREFIGALRDGGEVSFTMIFSAATFLIAKSHFEDDQPKQYAIILPDDDGTTFEFDGLLKSLPVDISGDDAVQSSVSIKVSGEPVLSGCLSITAVAAINGISKASGTQLASLTLPSTVNCTMSDGTTSAVAIHWDCGDPMYAGTAGAYDFVGTLLPASGEYNPLGLTATVTVTIT